jgi:hypothetical protein
VRWPLCNDARAEIRDRTYRLRQNNVRSSLDRLVRGEAERTIAVFMAGGMRVNDLRCADDQQERNAREHYDG